MQRRLRPIFCDPQDHTLLVFVLLGILFVLLDLALHSTPHVTAQPLFTCRCLNAAACAGVPSSLCSTLSSLCSTL